MFGQATNAPRDAAHEPELEEVRENIARYLAEHDAMEPRVSLLPGSVEEGASNLD